MAPSEGSEGAGCGGKRKRGLGPHSSEEEALEWLRTDVLSGKNLPVYEKVRTKNFERPRAALPERPPLLSAPPACSAGAARQGGWERPLPPLEAAAARRPRRRLCFSTEFLRC